MQPETILNAKDTKLRATISSLRNLKPRRGKQMHKSSSAVWRLLRSRFALSLSLVDPVEYQIFKDFL